MNRKITTRRMGNWGDIKCFLRLTPRVKVIEDGRLRSIQSGARMLAIIEAAERGAEQIQDGWRPWYVGTCGDQTAVSLTDDWARTRWLLAAD